MNTIFQSKVLKYSAITILITLLTGIAIIIYFSYNPNDYYELREYLNKNSMIIKTTKNIDIDKVDVYWFSDFKSGQVIKSGKTTNLVYKEYGSNRFVVLYKKDTVKKFVYGKSNNWHGHKHIISLSKKENKNIKVEVQIIGPDIK